jgi:hypothetical protein
MSAQVIRLKKHVVPNVISVVTVAAARTIETIIRKWARTRWLVLFAVVAGAVLAVIAIKLLALLATVFDISFLRDVGGNAGPGAAAGATGAGAAAGAVGGGSGSGSGGSSSPRGPAAPPRIPAEATGRPANQQRAIDAAAGSPFWQPDYPPETRANGVRFGLEASEGWESLRGKGQPGGR